MDLRDASDALLKQMLKDQEFQKDASKDWVHVLGTKHTHVYNLSNTSRKVGSSFHEAHGEKVITYQNKDGEEKTMALTKYWICDPLRQRVDNYTFDPTQPPGFTPSSDPKELGILNLWPGIPDAAAAAWPRDSIEAYKVRRSWERLMRGLFGSYWKWVALWAAHMLNKPEEATSQAVMLLTQVQGIGKSLFGEILIELLGGKGKKSLGTEIKAKDLGRNFNVVMEGKIFALVNELDNKFDNKESELNDLITAVEIFIEPKGLDQYPVPNLMRYYFTTNSANPCRMSPKQRRILVLTPDLLFKDGRGRWNLWVSKRIAGFKRDERALGVIRQGFDDLWAQEGEGKWDSHAPVPMTQASMDASESSMTGNTQAAHSMVDYIREHGWVAIDKGSMKLHAKVWGEIKGLVKAEGGRVMSKRIANAGKEITHTILDLGGGLEYGEKKDKFGHISEVRCMATIERNDLEQSIASTAMKMVDLLSGGDRWKR